MCQNCNQNNCGGCTEVTTICTQCQSEEVTCDCPIANLSTDCVLYTNDDIECNSVVVVPKNTILTDALALMTDHNCTKFDELANYLRIINIGTGASIYAGDNLIGEKKIRKINSTSPIVTVTENTNDISLGIDAVSLDTFIEANQKTYSATNIGTGASVYKDNTIVGNNTQFNIRKIKSSDSSVTISEATNEIDITLVTEDAVTNGSLNPVTSNAVFDAFTAASVEVKKEYIVIPLSDLITNLTTGVTKAYFRMPFAATIDLVSASVVEAQTAGSVLTFDINEGGVSILSTKLTIDNNQKTSITATTPPVISDLTLAYNSEITFDIDQVGTAGAKGAVITLSLTRV